MLIARVIPDWVAIVGGVILFFWFLYLVLNDGPADENDGNPAPDDAGSAPTPGNNQL